MQWSPSSLNPRMMPTKKMLLMMLTQLTIVLLTEAAEIKSSTVDPRSSEAYITEEGSFYHAEDHPAAVAPEEHKEEQKDAGGSHDQQDVDRGSEHHEELHGHHWNYHGDNGPKNWSSMHKDCAGRYQSPINIAIESTKLNELLTEISLLVHNVSGDRITIINNGHTVNFAYDHTTMRLDGGAYDHTYRVAAVHFHWGDDDSEGSEHMIQGEHFPLEMHIVCYDEDDYNSVGEAMSSRDGIAVLGVLFTVSENDNIYLDPLISHLKDVIDPDKPVSLDYFNLEKLLPLNRKNYFRYSGSLTTPPCSESVLWTVFEKTQTISSTQLAEFRTLHESVHTNGTEDDNLRHNWRPAQPIFKRLVYRSFPAAMAVSHLSPDDAQHNQIDDHQQPYNAATSVVWNNIFIGWIAFYLITTML